MKIYKTPRELEKAIKGYFDSISRTVTVKEPVGTGELDKYGHEKKKLTSVKNKLGKVVRRTEFIVPPVRSAMLRRIGLTEDAWEEYRRREEYREIIEDAESVLQIWREEQLLERPGKDIKGLLRDMERLDAYTAGVSSRAEAAEITLSIEEKQRTLAEIMEEIKGGGE